MLDAAMEAVINLDIVCATLTDDLEDGAAHSDLVMRTFVYAA